MRISDLLIFGSRWSCLISIFPEKFEFYEYKMYLQQLKRYLRLTLVFMRITGKV